jgi:hypothetical protein
MPTTSKPSDKYNPSRKNFNHSKSYSNNYLFCLLPPRPAISFQQTKQFLSYLGRTFLIGGDFNAKHLLCGCQVQNIRGRMFQNIIQNKNCSVIPPPNPTYWPTHQNRHPDILDFFISSIPKHIHFTIKSLDDPTCDHSPIFMKISGKTTQNPPHPSLAKGPVNWDYFSKSLENLTNLNISLKTNDQIEEAVQNLTKSLQTTIFNSSNPINILNNSISNNILPPYIHELI